MNTEKNTKEETQQQESTKPTKVGNQKLFIGLIVGALIGAVFALHGLELLPGGYKYAAAVMIGAFFIVAFLLLLTVFFRDRIIRYFFGDVAEIDSFRSDAKALIGSTAEAISDTVTKPFPEESRKRMRWIAPKLANYLIWGRVRSWWFNLLITVFLAIGGLATTVLLVNQNKLLEVQNKKIDIQNALAEGQRRSSLVLIIENVLNDLSKEIDQHKIGLSKEEVSALDTVGYKLSDPLIGRISSLAQGLLPYQMLMKGELTEEEYSPERSQLLLAIEGSNLDTTTLKSIYSGTSFASSYLVEVNLGGVNFSEAGLLRANLTGANLTGANLRGVNFTGANLTGANLTRADLREAKLREAKLREADLREAKLTGADLWLADLWQAKLLTTDLRKANLSSAYLRGANLAGANLAGADLPGADLVFVTLLRANLSETKLYAANLMAADLREANLRGANLSAADLNDALGVTKELLLTCKSLYRTLGIDQWKEELEKEKPCLFTIEGCLR